MQRRYITVDVFTDRAFGGNPLAVVLDAGGLSTAQMQAIATEFNYSETTFVLPPHDTAHDAQVRIFTVRSEIPFAGHPNVGTAFVLATQAGKPPARLQVRGKGGSGAGRNPDRSRAGSIGAELTAPQPLKRMTQLSAEQAAACLSLSAADVKTDRHPPQIVIGRIAVSGGGGGLARGAAAGEAGCRRHSARLFRATAATRSISTRAMCRRAKQPLDLQARMFHPGASGLSEDPATGSATVAAAALLADLDGDARRRTEIADRPGCRHGTAEPVADARPQARRRGGLRPCRRRLRADDGGNVSAQRGGVRWSVKSGHSGLALRAPRNDECHTCGATRFSTLTPSRSSMISAIHCRWQCLWSRS